MTGTNQPARALLICGWIHGELHVCSEMEEVITSGKWGFSYIDVRKGTDGLVRKGIGYTAYKTKAMRRVNHCPFCGGFVRRESDGNDI